MAKQPLHLVLLHGFASNKFIWQDFAAVLAQEYQVTVLDLPGYGDNLVPECDTLEAIAKNIIEQVSPPVIWMGWSLGGLIAWQLAKQYPELTQGVITFAANPKFIAADDWPGGGLNNFNVLKKVLLTQPELIMARFLNLQTRGTASDRGLQKCLNAIQKKYPTPPSTILKRDLDFLETTDFRASLQQLACPQLNIWGAEDRLIPAAVCDALKDLCPSAQNVTIAQAAHVPFISHQRECLSHINKFIHESIAID